MVKTDSDNRNKDVPQCSQYSLSDLISGTTVEEQLLSFVLPNLRAGGAEQVVITLLNGLASRGYSVELLLSEYSGPLKTELDDSVKVATLPPARTSVFGVAAHLPAIAMYLQQKNPAAMFPHLEHPSVVCLTAHIATDTDTVVIPTQHSTLVGPGGGTPKDRIVDNLVPHLYPSANRIIAVAQGVANSITERTAVDPSDVSILHNPVDIDRIQRQAQEPLEHDWFVNDELKVILFVGRIAPEKDLQTWLQVFNSVHAENPRTRAVIAGRGPDREELLQFAERLGIADVVAMPGYVDNPYKYMKRASVFLLSSRREGLPTVLIEALACGCPVVATDCRSGPREVLADGQFGQLAPVAEPSQIAKAVSEVLEQSPAPAKLRSRADNFAATSVLDDYEQFLTEHVFGT